MSEAVTSLHTPSVAAWQRFPLPTHVDDVRRWLTAGASLPALIAEQARRHAGKTALVVDDDAATYRQLVDQSAMVAGWLLAQGVSAGDRVLLAGQNSLELMIACLGTMSAGAVEVVANPTSTQRELRHLVDDCAPDAVIADADILTRVEGLPADAPALLLRSGGDAMPPALGDVARARRVASLPSLAPDAVAALQYTSGTTGEPKGTRLTHANLVAYMRSVHLTWHWRPDDVLVHSLPLAHGHGRNGVYTALLAGATAVVLPRSDIDRLIATIRDRSATVLYSVPAIWEKLLAHPDFGPESFKSLRLYTTGSAPLAPSTSDRIKAVLGERPLDRWGATETGAAVSTILEGPRYAGCVGIAVPGAEVRVATPEGDEMPDGEIGEVLVRGPAVFDGYWGRTSSDIFAPGGWYRTGDLGMFDPERDRYLGLTGRSKEMIISGGLNVYPREVELVAESAEGVLEAAAVGVPSQRWGEQVVLAVVPDVGAAIDANRLLSWMREQLAPYKVPKECKVVDAIPRTVMGKILRSELTERWLSL